MVVIGILTAIAVPIFANQAREGVEATLKSDMRNSAVVIMTEASRNQGRMPAWLPNYATKSPDNMVTVVTSRSNQYVFCLRGENPNAANIYYYSSVTGELSTNACPSVANGGVGGNPVGGGGLPVSSAPSTGVSWDEKKEAEAPEKKALFVSGESGTRDSVMSAQLESYGYGEVVRVSWQDFVDMPESQINDYDLLFATWNYRRPGAYSSEIEPKMRAFYEQGGKVMQDGNDSRESDNPLIGSTAHGASVGVLSYTPTRNSGLSPAFLYTFSASEHYTSDSSWRCITSLTAGAVSIAEAQHNGNTCIMVFAGSNSNGGRWGFSSRFINIGAGVDKALLDWLNG